jgi:hypothetical protein
MGSRYAPGEAMETEPRMIRRWLMRRERQQLDRNPASRQDHFHRGDDVQDPELVLLALRQHRVALERGAKRS